MYRSHLRSLCLFLSLTLFLSGSAPEKLTFSQYHPPQEIAQLLKSWGKKYPNLTKLVTIGQTNGKSDLTVIRIASQPKGSPGPDFRPGILVSANMEGNHLVGTYKHPLFGDIEIGDVKKFGSRVPPFFKLAETCHRNAAFCLYHADQLPSLTFNKVDIKKLKKNLYQIDVSIENTRATPSISAIAAQKKLHRADKIRVEGKNIELLAAGRLTDRFRGTTQNIKPHKDFIWVESGIPSFGKVDFRLLVKASGNIELIYDSLKGGYYTKAVKLE